MDEITVAAKIGDIQMHESPWPHGTLDDFLPADVFAELVAELPAFQWQEQNGRTRKAKRFHRATMDLLGSETVLNAIRQRFGFTGGKPTIDLVYREQPLPPHCDRKDKVWNGQIYVAGDPKGTELYDAAGNLAHVIEWRPNRLSCWMQPPNREQHAAQASSGRYVLLWWILGGTKL